MHPDLETADYAFPPPRTALSHSKMLVRFLCYFLCLTFISGKLLKFWTSFLLRICVYFSIYFIVLLVEQRRAFCPLIAFWWVRSFIKSKSWFSWWTRIVAFCVDIFENVKLLGCTIYLLNLVLAFKIESFHCWRQGMSSRLHLN